MAVLAKDLRSEFYAVFKEEAKLFDLLMKLIDHKSPEVELTALEDAN